MNEEQLKYYKLTKVTKRDLDEGVWDAEHKGLYSKDGKRLLMYQRPEEHVGKGKQDVFTFMPGVEIICNKAFEHGSFLRGFKLPDTIVAIGEHALAHVMRSGERLVFPKSLKYFGNHIFGHSEGVFEVEFEEGFKEVDFGNVLEFGSAITVHIPSTLTSIGSYWGSSQTVAIHVAEGNKHFCIDDDVLYNYDKTKMIRCPFIKRGKLVVPEGVTTIGRNAFTWCGSNLDASTMGQPLLSVILPQSLERIAAGAFRCSHLNSLFIGPKVSGIEKNAFEDHFIKEIIVSEDNPYYESYKGMLIDKKAKELITISGNFTGKDIAHKYFEVKNNVLIDKNRNVALLGIGYSPYGSNAYLAVWPEDDFKPTTNNSRDLDVPKGIEIIDGNAFVYNNFNSIVIPEGVTYIGDGAFRYMTATSIYLPSTLCYISPSTITSVMNGLQPFSSRIYVPKGMMRKFERYGYYVVRYNFEELDREETSPLIGEGVSNDYMCQIEVTNDDLNNSIVDRYQIRYSHDGKRLLKFEGFHSRLSNCVVADGTEIICNKATATDRYQYVRTFIVPESVKYIGSCPSFDRLFICGTNVRFATSSIALRKNDTVYIPCGTWGYYYNELEKARRGRQDRKTYYRLVELSKASVAMYLKQQLQILLDLINSTKLVSEYVVKSINGDKEKKYICYRDVNRSIVLDIEQLYSTYLHKVLSVLGFNYQDIMDILELDIDEIEVNENNKSLLIGRTLARNAIQYWTEDFIDEDTGEVVPIEVPDTKYIWGRKLYDDEIQTLIDSGIPSVSVFHDSESHEINYLGFFAYYSDPDANSYDIYAENSVLRHFFPDKKPNHVTMEEKKILGYNLIILLKSIIDNSGSYVDNILPLKTKDVELHTIVSEEEDNLAKLLSEYYQVLIDKVRSCDRETDVMPIFPITQDYRELRLYLVSHNVDEHLIDSIVTPAINMIQIE